MFELLQPWRQLCTGPLAGFQGDVVPFPPFGVDALEFHLAGGPVQVLSNQSGVSLRDPPRIFGRGLGPQMHLGCLGVGDVERRKELTDDGLLFQGRGIDAPRAGFMALSLRVELLPLGLELLHLGGRLAGAAVELLLRFSRRAQMAAQLLHVALAIEWKHGETGVRLLAAPLFGDGLFQGVNPFQPAPPLLEP